MGLLIIAATLAVTLQPAMRFGMTKAVRFILIAMALVALVAFAASGSGDALHIAESLGACSRTSTARRCSPLLPSPPP